MIQKWRFFFSQLRRVRQQAAQRSQLDYVLDSLDPEAPLNDKIEWLIVLMRWIRYEVEIETSSHVEIGRQPAVRFKFLINLLDRNPQWKEKVSSALLEVFSSVSGMELFCETGLAKEVGLWAELRERFLLKILPKMPFDEDMTTFIAELFPAETDADWIKSIDPDTRKRFVALLSENPKSHIAWNSLAKGCEDALLFMVIHVRALSLSPLIRKRLDTQDLRMVSFFSLAAVAERFASQRDSTLRKSEGQKLLALINNCHVELESVSRHLEEFGVSTQVVYQVEVLREYLLRIRTMVSLLSEDHRSGHLPFEFLSQLISDVHEMRSLKSLLKQNSAMLSRKIAERTAASGEHYITRNSTEYRTMLVAAAGGGAVTAFTVYVKILIYSLGLSAFLSGLLSAFNYTISFVGIHLAGFTLGTKQPAMTAPALANKMQSTGENPERLAELIEDIIAIIRSQVASVLGNVLLVVPVVLFIDSLSFFIFGSHLMPMSKAENALGDVDILSFVPVYAAFTGLILWLSSLVAGWFDNWFAFRGLRQRIMKNRTFNQAFGKIGARKIATFFSENISGLSGNIALGLLLGLAPEVLRFIGIPLDIRHITLSSGTVAAAIPVLGWDVLGTVEFARAAMGLFIIALLNVGISFSLALNVAVRARSVSTAHKEDIYRRLRGEFFRRPWRFFIP